MSNKQVIGSNNTNFLKRVKIYPITPCLIEKMQSPVISAKNNPGLNKAIADYKYRVEPGGILSVTVWDHPELTIPAGSYRTSSESGNWIRPDGNIFYPYIGFVHVAGKTITQIRNLIADRLATYIEDPQVDVNVAAFRSQKVYLTGAVNKPGTQAITNVPLTLLAAINKAGGLAPDADWQDVTITHNGHSQRLSMYALLDKGNLMENRLLHAGDIIHVPTDQQQKVFVLGEVRDPKVLNIKQNGLTLTGALSAVGGINQLSANATGVFVIRCPNRSAVTGDITHRLSATAPVAKIYQLNIKDATALVLGTEFKLQPYDVVYVTAAPIARWNRVLSNILPNITGLSDIANITDNIRNL